MTVLLQVRRLSHIGRVLSAHLMAHLLGRWLRQWPGLTRRLPALALTGPERLRRACEDLGGTFVKFGQMLALQPDILSFAYCRALYDLLDNLSPFEAEAVDRMFREELGRLPTEVFETFDPQPIASASIGQVHIAYRDGQKLAVKVQRPNAEADFHADTLLMMGWVRIIQGLRLARFYWMIEPIVEFVDWTGEELDFRHEARYMAQLRVNAGQNLKEHVPAVVWEVTTRRIVTAEYLDGVTVLQYLRALERGDELMPVRLAQHGFDPSVFAQHIIDNFVGDAFTYGLYHADLHPANLLILHDNTVGYVDFGITGVLSHYSRQQLIKMTLAYTQGDLDGMQTAFLQISTTSAESNPAGFRQGLDDYAHDWYEVKGERRSLRKNFTMVMFDLLRLSRKTDIWPERDVIKYIRSAIAIDGLIARLSPPFNIGGYLEQVCEQQMHAQAQTLLFSQDAMLSWLNLSGYLLGDDTVRVVDRLHQIASGTLPLQVRLRRPASPAVHAGLLELAVIVVMMAVLMGFTEPRTLGWNLFTTQLTVVAGAFMMLVRRVVRLI